MIEVIGQGTHRISNIVFVALNVMSILFGLLGIVITTVYFTATDIVPNMGFARLVAGFSILVFYILGSAILAGMAQALRYLATIASASSHKALKLPTTTTVP